MESLAVKYRPKDFDSVVGQDVIVEILRKQIETNMIKNAYIFSGASGCGKTTTARIFANEINNHLGNPIEIDGASNNGVDNVKQIVSESAQRSVDSEYKIYIIDEAHMLTTQAWNAFLKTIEESPKYTIFIFCTTDPQKIPDTIKNRCMRFNFTRIKPDTIFSRLTYICNNEHISASDDVLNYISRISHGEMRNAISKLETCVDYSDKLTIENVLSALGNYSYDVYFELVNSIVDGNYQKCDEIINNIYNDGIDMKLFVTDFISFVLDIMKFSLNKDINCTKLPINYLDKLNFAIGFDNSTKYYNYYLDKLLDLKNMLKTDLDSYQTISIMISRMCRLV